MWPEESERRYEGSGVAGKGGTRPEEREEAGGEARKCALGEAMGRKSDCVVAAATSCLCASFTSLLPAVPRKSVSHSSSVLRESQDPWSQPCAIVSFFGLFLAITSFTGPSARARRWRVHGGSDGCDAGQLCGFAAS